MKALNPRLTHEYGKGWVFSAELDSESVAQAKIICDGYPTGYFELTVEKWSEKRSLQANAYFHVLANLIAKETKSSMDDVKKLLVSQYGTIAMGSDGKYAAVKLPKNTDPEQFYPYYKFVRSDPDGDIYVLFKRTSQLNKDEMNRLIQGTVDEAKALQIETMTPQELETMMSRYKEGS